MAYTHPMIRKLSETECRDLMERGDIETGLAAGPAAALILTQSWCPQWAAMKAYYVEYYIEPWESLKYETFMSFKENTFRNREIPYVRYYRNGGYYRDSNYISLEGFKERLGIPH